MSLSDNRLDESEERAAAPVDLGPTPGVPLSDGHRAFLIDQGISADYLDAAHVAPLLRSVTSLAELPATFRHAVTTDKPEGIIFGHRDPKTSKITWQFRPDSPVGEMKYVFPKGSGSPVALRSRPLSDVADVSDRTMLIVEGTKQALAAAAVVADRPEFVVVGIAGCWGGTVSNAEKTAKRLQPGILAALEGAEHAVVIPDADAAASHKVYSAMQELGKLLRANFGRKRDRVKFGRLAELDGAGEHSGIDDILAACDPLERQAILLSVIESAKSTPADIAPKKNARPSRHSEDGAGGDESLDTDRMRFFHPFAGGLRAKACADEVMRRVTLLLDKQAQVLWAYNPTTGLYEVDASAGKSSTSAIVRQELGDILGDDYRSSHTGTVTDLVKARLQRDVRFLPSKPRLRTGQVPVENGILDMRTGVVLPHSPDFGLTAKITVEFDPEARADFFREWLRGATTLPDGTDQVDIVLDSFSVLLETITVQRSPDVCPYLYGAPRAGKGTLCNDIVSHMVADEVTAGMNLSELARASATDATRLYRKFLSISGETADKFVEDTSTMKRLTGGDTVPANIKFGAQFEFRSTAFMVFQGNKLPHVNDVTGAFTARIIPIRFDRSNIGREERGIGKKLRAELPGILNLFVDAWRKRQERGGSMLEPAPLAAKAFQDSTNPVAEFANECLEIPTTEDFVGEKTVKDGWGVTQLVLYAEYDRWTRAANGKPLKRSNFLEALSALGVRGTNKEDGVINQTKTRVVAVRLVPEGFNDGQAPAPYGKSA